MVTIRYSYDVLYKWFQNLGCVEDPRSVDELLEFIEGKPPTESKGASSRKSKRRRKKTVQIQPLLKNKQKPRNNNNKSNNKLTKQNKKVNHFHNQSQSQSQNFQSEVERNNSQHSESNFKSELITSNTCQTESKKTDIVSDVKKVDPFVSEINDDTSGIHSDPCDDLDPELNAALDKEVEEFRLRLESVNKDNVLLYYYYYYYKSIN
jgi:hypothetical protein